MAGETFTQDQVDAMIAERLTSEVAGLKANQAEAIKEARAAKAKLAAYEGVDPVEYKALKDAAAAAELKKAAAEGDFETLKKQLVDNHGKEIAARDARITKYDAALQRRLVDAELTRAIAAKKGDPDLLLPFARQFVRVRETENDFEGYVADERGNPLVADGKGTPMTFDLFVEQNLMTKFPRAFEGTGSSGGGAPIITAGGGGRSVIPRPTAGDASANGAFISNLKGVADGSVVVGS